MHKAYQICKWVKRGYTETSRLFVAIVVGRMPSSAGDPPVAPEILDHPQRFTGPELRGRAENKRERRSPGNRARCRR